MSNRVVVKFGGTSVKTKEAIEKACDIIESNGNISFIVVSAVGGVTNLLVKFCTAMMVERQKIADEILQIHLDLASSLGLSLSDVIRQKIDRLHLGDLPDLSAEQVDHIVSLGEDLSSIIVFEVLKLRGMKIGYVDARDIIITNDKFSRAIPDIESIKERMAQVISQSESELFVTQGFIGCTTGGKTTTLGRGGSDYSAALIAEALKANKLFIYTDVAGVYTMDPNIVKEAKVIEELSFAEMAEMANFGAKVLHPDTIEPCARSNIPIRVCSTFEPDKSGTTVFWPTRASEDSVIHAVTIRKLQVLVTIKSLKMINAYGFLANIFEILAKYKVSVDLITTSEASVALTVDSNSILTSSFNNQELLNELEKFAEVNIEGNLSLVAVIGLGLIGSGVVRSVLAKLDRQFVRLICYGASSSNMGVLVKSEDAENIARLLHKELLEDI